MTALVDIHFVKHLASLGVSFQIVSLCASVAACPRRLGRICIRNVHQVSKCRRQIPTRRYRDPLIPHGHESLCHLYSSSCDMVQSDSPCQSQTSSPRALTCHSALRSRPSYLRQVSAPSLHSPALHCVFRALSGLDDLRRCHLIAAFGRASYRGPAPSLQLEFPETESCPELWKRPEVVA